MSYRNSSPFKTTTLANALAHTRQRIAGLTESPGLDAQVLLAYICNTSRTWVLAHPEYELNGEQNLSLAHAIAQLAAGVPLPYVIGEWEFYGLGFKVTPDVLIPRPETELLVESALKWLAEHPGRSRVAEAGTGSGCIAISLAVNSPNLSLTATDICAAALAVASQNAQRHKVEERLTLIETDLLQGVVGPFDLICANLPYIPSGTLRQLPVYWREPRLALDGGPDGLDLIRKLLMQAAKLLAPGGLALLEIEAGQPEAAREAAAQCFPQAEISTKLDLAGRHRLLTIHKR